jgi:hypothetical protein
MYRSLILNVWSTLSVIFSPSARHEILEIYYRDVSRSYMAIYMRAEKNKITCARERKIDRLLLPTEYMGPYWHNISTWSFGRVPRRRRPRCILPSRMLVLLSIVPASFVPRSVKPPERTVRRTVPLLGILLHEVSDAFQCCYSDKGGVACGQTTQTPSFGQMRCGVQRWKQIQWYLVLHFKRCYTYMLHKSWDISLWSF